MYSAGTYGSSYIWGPRTRTYMYSCNVGITAQVPKIMKILYIVGAHATMRVADVVYTGISNITGAYFYNFLDQGAASCLKRPEFPRHVSGGLQANAAQL